MDKKIKELYDFASKVSASAYKVQMYHQSRKVPPEKLQTELEELTKQLDEKMAFLLMQHPSLRDELMLIDQTESNDNVIEELELSYNKVVSAGQTEDGLFFKLYMMPFLYHEDSEGKERGVPKFKPHQFEVIAEFLDGFIKARCDVDADEVIVKFSNQVIRNWMVAPEEEKHLAAFGRAIAAGKGFKLDAHFKERLENNPSERLAGWSIGVIPLVLICKDEELLEAIEFEPDEDEFEEKFNEIFNQDESLDVHYPVDPMGVSDQGTKFLWLKQIDLTVKEMIKGKKANELGIVEMHFGWFDGALAKVSTQFKVIAKAGVDWTKMDQPECDEVRFFKDVSRRPLLSEMPADSVAFLSTFSPLMRSDFRVIVKHYNATLEDLGIIDGDDPDQDDDD